MSADRRCAGKSGVPGRAVSDTGAIGVFDSGLGGLTVLREIRKLLPNEKLIYFGDNGRTPYGTKSPDTVRRYTVQDVNFLLSKNVKAIVIACNTASACSLGTVREKFSVPVIEVVGPGSEAAVKATVSGRIGVIGTAATVESGVYEKAIMNAAEKEGRSGVKYFGKACPLFVSLAEEGWWDGEITRLTAEKYLDSLKSENIDTLVLGCTHYPLLAGVIGSVMGSGVKLINSASAVALSLKEQLGLADASKTVSKDSQIDFPEGSVRFYTSDSVARFRALGGKFLGGSIEAVEKVDIEKY